MPARKDLKRILIPGSGPIVIGQACEFDYSGNQAVRALKELGYEVVLVNPNPATVMTTPGTADRIYMDPLEVPYLEEIIRVERPDGILATMGGQTALNLTLDLQRAGVLDRFSVEVLGARPDSIELAEDRGKFKEVVASIGLESPRSALVDDLRSARAFQSTVGYPIIIRPSFTLGGRGGSIAYNEGEFTDRMERAFHESPTGQALVEESLLGWKEFELEVMRDQADNAVIVCSIENIDPMGVHTGDSITVAPAQTLSDREYQTMRDAGIEILRAVGVDCGGSNVQFAINPHDGRMVVIEMNPRVSRSSALASKATGFPIARCSAQLAVGKTLDEVINDITGKTVSAFEPALDYVAVKVPRFELEKFPEGYRELGTQMKSVGESLAIGRTFVEALNKAIRAGEFGFSGLEDLSAVAGEAVDEMIDTLHPRRLFAVYTDLRRRPHGSGEPTDAGYLEELSQRTGYDRWFLHEIAELAELESRIEHGPIDRDLLFEAKRSGIADRRIAALAGTDEQSIVDMRVAMEITPGYHFVDTCAGEFEADTPYFYGTYGEVDEGTPTGEGGVVILASGPNRIGQGLEFDTCCTLSSIAYRRLGIKTIIVNSNPETVSTDFNVSDRLYIEPLTPEDVGAVLNKERVRDVVVQLGGQTPLNMAEQLKQMGADAVGTPVDAILAAEDRGKFAELLRRLDLRQPNNRMAGSREAVARAADEIGYPVLVRPSFVLGGRSMVVAYTPDELRDFLARGVEISEDRPILVDQFLEDAFEYDIDAVCDGENVYIGGVMQHIEAAGVHSGDSACVFPPYRSTPETVAELRAATVRIARALGVRGLLNIQFAVREGLVYVLEVNPRASRTVPFLSKASGVDIIDATVKVWHGISLVEQGLATEAGPDGSMVGYGACITGWAVKEAVFSFDRFLDVDPLLGPEMRSTGEVIGLGAGFGEAFAKASMAAGSRLPTTGRVFVSVHDSDKQTILPIVVELQRLGFSISATRGTANFLFANGVFAEVILKVHEGRPHIVDHMHAGRIDMVVNTPLGRYTQRDDGYIRIEALRRGIPYTTTTSAAQAALEGIRYLRTGRVTARPLPG